MKRNLTKRETIQQQNAWDAHYAALSGRPAKHQQAVPETRVIANRTDASELEAAVMREVSKVLSVHPRVLYAERRNSGAAYLPSKGGRDAPVRFYHVVRAKSKMTVPDFTGFTVDGKPIAFECKRRDWKFTGTERELEQMHYLKMVTSIGGISSFIVDADQVIYLLNEGTT